MKLSFCPSAAFIISTLVASSAMAVDPMHWITDSRICTANFSGNGSGSTWHDPSVVFNPFQGAADLFATNGIETWTARSTQSSQMDGHSASFEGWASGTIMANMASDPLVAQSSAKFDVWFSIDAPMEYDISGLLTETGHADSTSLVRLTTVDGAVVEVISSVPDTARGFHRSGVIQPGTYRLYAEAKGLCRTFSPMIFSHGDATCVMEFALDAAPVAPPPPRRPKMTSSAAAPRRPE